MDSEPSPAPPDPPARSSAPAPVPVAPTPRSAWPIVLGILLPFVWAGIAFAVGLMAMLMMAFMSDAGLKDQELQENALVATLVSIAVAGVAGIPVGVGIAARKIRRPALVFGAILGIGGLVGAIVAFLVYFSAFLK